MDKRIGTRTDKGAVERWPEQYISGRPFVKGDAAVSTTRLDNRHFCVIDPFPVVDKESTLAELRASLQPKARAVKVEAG